MPARPPRRHLPAHQDLEGVPGPERETKLARIEHVLDRFPNRAFAFDERPARDPSHRGRGLGRTTASRPAAGHLPPHPRSPVLPRLLLGGRRSPVGRESAPEGSREHAGRAEIDPRRPPGRCTDLRDPGQPVRPQGRRHPSLNEETQGERCFTPTYASWANPIKGHFGPLRQFTIANSNHPNHMVQTRTLHAYLRWRNANARHRDVLATERKERARIRSEKGIRWGGRPALAA